MKPRTFFGLALLFPYILWILCALVVFLLSPLETSTEWDTALMPVFFYAFGIVFWFIPYTTLAMGLWLWSRGRSSTAFYKMAMVSPLLLAVLLLVEALLVSLPVDNIMELTKDLPGQAAFLGGFSLIYGYLCVGSALGIFKFLQARKLIAMETPPTSSADQSTFTTP